MVSLSVPIFSSGMRLARVGEAKIALEKTSNQREMVQQNLTIGYQQAKINYNKAVNDYRSLKENLALTEKVYNQTLIKYKEGVSSSLELTQAQNQYLTTESSYYNAILNLFNAKTALERLLATE
jgi:outer membrane protein TolC